MIARSLISCVALWALGAYADAGSPEGEVQFLKIANSSFDGYITDTTLGEQQWMQAHFDRIQGWSPFFTSRLAWFPDAWFYQDAYAIFDDWQIFQDHPEWVLRDPDGNMLYIPWGCSGGTCPQFAGDFGNPEFRAWWIAEAQATLAEGYRGIWVDDVNLDWRVSDGNANFVQPIDPRTGELMLYADWRRYMAEFVEQIRLALPTAEIAHNVIWFAADQVDLDNPFVNRGIDAADYVNLERGIADSNLTGDDGDFGVTTFLAYIEFVHSRGKQVILMDEADDVIEREYALAGWFLISTGDDLMTSENQNWTVPDSWWSGYDLNLGGALGPRYEWEGLLRRDFTCGMVLLNQPDRASLTVSLPRTLKTLDDLQVDSVTLNERTAFIGLDECATATVDLDSDGVFDIFDNCLIDANPGQIDANGDGYGNTCDADFNNDCVINAIDLGILKSRFFSADAETDLNGDGIVNVVELGIVKSRFFSTPGPSGAAGAPCTN